MYKKERDQIARVRRGFHRIQNVKMLEFLLDTQKHGIKMMNYYRQTLTVKRLDARMTPVPRASEQSRYKRKVTENGMFMSRLSHMQHIIELSILIGGPIKPIVTESVSEDLQRHIDSVATLPFRRHPADTIWDAMNDPSQQAKMREVISKAILNNRNKVEVINELEQFLRVDRNYPRWLQGRLDHLKPPRSGNPHGLLSGYRQDNKTSGFAYYAYRMYNTEYAIFSADLSTRLANENPYITHKNVTLSPFHPFCDACNKASKKRWLKSDNPLPIHPNCLCYYSNRVSNKLISQLRKDYKEALGDARTPDNFRRLDTLFSGIDLVQSGRVIYAQFADYL